jgi:TrmH family RNA methyltransferase
MLSVKHITKIQQKKYRQEFGCFLVEGKRAVFDALASKANIMQLIVTDRFMQHEQEFFRSPQNRAFIQQNNVLEIGESTFAKMVDTVTPQGIAAVVKLPTNTITALEHAKLIAVLEDIRDPGNLGTMIRTADWFGVEGMLLVGGADPYQPKVVRSSMGSLFHVPLVLSHAMSQELATLKQQGFVIIVTRPEMASPKKISHTTSKKQCLVFGSEAHGTSSAIDALADRTLSIPKFGKAESLNVAVSFGIVMHTLRSS